MMSRGQKKRRDKFRKRVRRFFKREARTRAVMFALASHAELTVPKRFARPVLLMPSLPLKIREMVEQQLRESFATKLLQRVMYGGRKGRRAKHRLDRMPRDHWDRGLGPGSIYPLSRISYK